MDKKLAYKRILLKLSGEMFGLKNRSIDFDQVHKVASIIQKVRKHTSVEMSIVVGAGNLFRGRSIEGTNVDHAVADYIGMLGTIMNALALTRRNYQRKSESERKCISDCKRYVLNFNYKLFK